MGFSTIISTSQLSECLGEVNCRVFDCRFSLADVDAGIKAYMDGHIQGAQYVHLDNDLSSPRRSGTGRHPLPDIETFAAKLGAWGVDGDTQVVAYDDSGGAIASRMWWLLRWLGHEDVAVLDGGIRLWQQEGRPLVTDVPAPDAVKFKPVINKDMLITSDDVVENLESNHYLIMDVRDIARFQGKEEPLDPVAGHIPGAINCPFMKNLSQKGTYKSKDELLEMYQSVIDREPESVACMCGSGVTACHSLLAMEIAGLSGAKLYAGSWSEWLADPARPVASGD